MKLYLSVDIEGITGAQHWDETEIGKPGYEALRERMNLDTNALTTASLEAGATEVLVKDAHDSGRNLDPEALPRGCQLIRGWSEDPLSMVQELDASFQGLMMLGYHSSAQEAGSPIAHSMSTQLSDARLNGLPASEMRLHALAAAEFGVPLILLSGDEGVCQEGMDWIPGLRTVSSQTGVGGSVICRHPLDVREELSQAVAEVLAGPLPVLPVLEDEYVLDLRYRTLAAAFRAAQFPGAESQGPHDVRLRATSARELLRALIFLA